MYMENYIVRIYRRDEQGPGSLVGFVEEVENQQRHSFKNLSELIAILSRPAPADKQSSEIELV